MAIIAEQATLEVTAKFTVSEGELRALDALACYGDSVLIEMFYKNCGTTYLKPHEAHLREFLKTIRDIAGPIIKRADEARKVFKGVK